jgi:hypothetical protein
MVKPLAVASMQSENRFSKWREFKDKRESTTGIVVVR